ncbi:zinc finger protein 592-like [Huso huso]|uniref:Zinc finger protein 592-like n=1 Tax=Huso huso TaxID=61971 RepID=A0ABR0YRE0_HUSHU
MGDMKTPDFDDLLAAFDIPDATSLDAKEAIQTSNDEADSHLKPAGMCMEENISMHHAVPVPDIPAVSVIVKNTSRQESSESSSEKDGNPLGHSFLQNGFQSSEVAPDPHNMGQDSYGKFESSFMNGGNSGSFSNRTEDQKTERMPPFSQFSPISSPEPEDSEKEERPKQEERPYFPAASVFVSAEHSVLDNQRKLPEFSMFDQCSKKEPKTETGSSKEKEVEISKSEQSRTEIKPKDTTNDHAKNNSFLGTAMLPLGDLQCNNLGEPKNTLVSETSFCSSVPPRQRIKSANSKLSSCLEALAALNAKKVAEVTKEEQLPVPREPSVAIKEAVKVSPKIPKSPKSPRSPLEVVKRSYKQLDSPMSVCSDSSGKASPSLAAGSPLAIPRVRIKTIKTSSGQIKRTVTSVLPDSELEELQSPESSPSQYQSSEDLTFKSTPPSCISTGVAVVENGKNKTNNKNTSTVASPSLSQQVTNVRPEGGVKKKATVLPSSSFQNASSAIMRVVNVVQQQQKKQKAAAAQVGSASNTNLLPKAVHLANLNLVPHSVAASVTARSTTQRQRQPQLTTQVVCSTVPLVHQVKKAAPAVSPVIPNAAVGALNRLLNGANPVPVYVPNLNPPPESNICLPARGYRCLECGDSFGLEKSLAQHYGRRSVHIKVACTHCAKALLFFNRCSLLAHAREHKSKGIVMQCSQVFMKPISPDQMFVSTPANSSVTSAPTSVLAGLPVPGMAPNNQPVMPLYSEKIVRHGLKCLDCNKQVSDYPSLAGHYQRFSEETEGLTCQVCMMMLPNKCSYAAHQRTHAHKSPYCCPECGAVSRSADFQTHVKENCLHYARKVGYKCIHCDVVFMSFYVLKNHIEEKHCEEFYKCSVCPVAFKSADSTISHIKKSKHPPPEASPQLIYKCSCETVFNKKQLLFHHFCQDTNKLLVCVFKCPECQLVFMHKQLLMQHFKGAHGVAKQTEVPETLRQKSETVSQSQEARPSTGQPRSNSTTKHLVDTPSVHKSESKIKLKNAGWTCGECLHWLPDRETFVSHMKKSHGRSMKRYPCRQCDRSFNSSTSLRRHMRNDHNGKKKNYTCWYCTDEKVTFTKHFMLKNHISLMHGIKNPDFSQMSRLAPPEKSSKTSSESLVAKRTAEDVNMEGAENAVSDVSPAKKLKPQYRCAKCGYSTENATEFQEHIPQHKTDNSTFQCLHCCLCYTSQMSLSRHLFIVHKVKEAVGEEEEEEEEDENFQTLKDNEKGGVTDAVGETNTSLEEGIMERQCNICCKTFDDESAYVAHMRIHGMPFLKTMQSGGPEQ